MLISESGSSTCLRFASLGSGSRGNATLVEWPQGLLIIDCGFSVKELMLRLPRLGIVPADITAILVTHEHGDHIKGIAALARRFNLPVYMTSGTFRSKNFGDLPELHLIDVNVPFVLNELKVTPVPVPHDACEPVQYVFDFAGRRLGILTDLGSISAHVERAYQDCDALLLEANYDPMMLASGGYPYSLKQRVGGAWGHLSNQQSGGFLERLDVHRLQHLVIAHMSQQNNTLTAVESVFAPIVSSVSQLTYADQDQGFDWLSIV